MKKNIKNSFYQILDFPFFDSANGMLAMFQGKAARAEKKLPFNIKKVLVMKGMKPKDIRGGHTHHKTRQILFAISGSCIVDLDNGKETAIVKLDKFNQGLLLEPYVWHVMKKYSPGTILLVLADREYNENDYIRDYNKFLKFVK